jgi:hypothetical protein
MDLLESAGAMIPPEAQAADTLTQYAVQSRYPGWAEAVTEEEYQRALGLARHVVSWAESVLGYEDPWEA